jgi:hypothetical protein
MKEVNRGQRGEYQRTQGNPDKILNGKRRMEK